MIDGRWAPFRERIERLFPERHLYIRSGGTVHNVTLSPFRQFAGAAAATVLAVWLGLASTVMLMDVLSPGDTGPARSVPAHPNPAEAARRIADDVEKRHQALALLIAELDPAATAAPAAGPTATPSDRVAQVRADQTRLIERAEHQAKTRADKLRLAFRSAGLNPARFTKSDTAMGGPLIELGDPKALAAVLEVDEDFAGRIQRASSTLEDLRKLSDAAARLPLAIPARAERSSGYGIRRDPFTRSAAFHSGLDFAGAHRTPITATAPGRVVFVGGRSGYGKVVEIDHGAGLKTRYAHLQSAAVAPGQKVALGQRIGAMGSTGRSTGTHLHYEIWMNGRAQNPTRFLRAGEHFRRLG